MGRILNCKNYQVLGDLPAANVAAEAAEHFLGLVMQQGQVDSHHITDDVRGSRSAAST
jgi:hypothetical protein